MQMFVTRRHALYFITAQCYTERGIPTASKGLREGMAVPQVGNTNVCSRELGNVWYDCT